MSRRFASSFGPSFGASYNAGTLVLNVRNGATYEDGDVLCAFTRRRTRMVHAERICQPSSAARQSNGLIAFDHISRRFFEAVREYRFERVSPTTVVRTNLWTNEVDVIGAVPNERSESMDVPRYIASRRRSPHFGIFGSDGAEVWYGGGARQTHAAAQDAWNLIEQHTMERESFYQAWPFGDAELRHFLAIHTDDFTEPAAAELVSPQVDTSNPDAPVVIHKRKHRLPWRELREMSSGRIANVLDANALVDVRAERKHVRAMHVRVKV